MSCGGYDSYLLKYTNIEMPFSKALSSRGGGFWGRGGGLRISWTENILYRILFLFSSSGDLAFFFSQWITIDVHNLKKKTHNKLCKTVNKKKITCWSDMINPECFYKELTKNIFDAMKTFYISCFSTKHERITMQFFSSKVLCHC